MTGHGRGEAVGKGGLRVIVECSSVNRKQSEILVNLPRDYAACEPAIREIALAKVARGRIQINVAMERNVSAIQLCRDAACEAFQQMKELQKELQLAGEIQVSDLFKVPNIWKTVSPHTNEKEIWSLVHDALLSALEGMLRMREREGKHLFEDLRKRLQILKRLLKQICRLLPAAHKHYRTLLIRRLEEAGIPHPDEKRLIEEVAWFCEKSDISEEFARLESHLDQLEEYVHASGVIGRTMEFLTQEIFRELNTLSAKGNSAKISQLVVDCKAELEKMREQISNVE